MKVVISINAVKSPQTDEEIQFMHEVMTNGKLEEWREEAQKSLYSLLKSELDEPEKLEVSVTVKEE